MQRCELNFSLTHLFFSRGAVETALSCELKGLYLTHFVRTGAPGIKRWLKCVWGSVSERENVCLCTSHVPHQYKESGFIIKLRGIVIWQPVMQRIYKAVKQNHSSHFSLFHYHQFNWSIPNFSVFSRHLCFRFVMHTPCNECSHNIHYKSIVHG